MIRCLAALLLFLNSCGERNPPVPARVGEYVSVHGTSTNADAVAAAKRGQFSVGKKETGLTVPVDWCMDPHGDRSWRFFLHSWTFLEPVVHAAVGGDPEAVRLCNDFALDWIEQNQRGASGISEFAWYDMAVGARAPTLGCLARLSRSSSGDARTAQVLLQSAREHGDWLADDQNYKAAHNHGLFQDGGLALLAMQLPSEPRARAWFAHAQRRFVDNVAATVSRVDAVHLEHSSAYHFTVTSLVDRIRRGARFRDAGLLDLVARMRANAPWFVHPDGKFLQLGDTDLTQAPAWVAEQPRPEGLWFARDAGVAAVAAEGERLVAHAWYHGSGHKHSDELSFVWFARGARLLVDAGRYGYYYDEPGRRYAESARAHNVLTRASRDFSFRGQAPYGSGLTGAGSGHGWHVVIGENPLLRSQEVEHRRLWLYRPGEVLFVVDLLKDRAVTASPFIRRFHFGPAISVAEDADGSWRLSAGGNILARMHDLSGAGVSVRAVRGQRSPELMGVTFPGNRSWQEIWTTELVSAPGITQLVTAFTLGAGAVAPVVRLTERQPGVFVAEFGSGVDAPDLLLGPADVDGDLQVSALR